MRTLNLGILAHVDAGKTTLTDAVMSVARLRGLQQLPASRRSEGSLETRFGGYRPIGDDPPRRPRSGPSPLDRDASLASLARRR